MKNITIQEIFDIIGKKGLEFIDTFLKSITYDITEYFQIVFAPTKMNLQIKEVKNLYRSRKNIHEIERFSKNMYIKRSLFFQVNNAVIISSKFSIKSAKEYFWIIDIYVIYQNIKGSEAINEIIKFKKNLLSEECV